MVRELLKSETNEFIRFGDSLYKNDKNYVPFLHKDLRKTLRILVFEKKKYKAVCSFDESGNMTGRILLTVGKNKQLHTAHCGYFSHFEVVNNQDIFNELIQYSMDILKEMGAEYILGSFFPFDPDNRRGILIHGFELSPMIFTSHNPDYYQKLFESAGFSWVTDAYEYEYKDNPDVISRIKEIAEKSVMDNDIVISPIDYKNIDREIKDIHTIMEIASTQINFEEVISEKKIRKIFESWKMYIEPDFALIARKNSDNSPIGFAFSILDYFELIRKMKGRLNLRGILVFLFGRKRLHGLRGMLQYIIPEYQHKGVSKALYYETYKATLKHNITRVSLGTIMEANEKSNGSMRSIGGELSRIYRIYYKKLS